jgi:hypothetical protein
MFWGLKAKLKREFSNPENTRDAERGIALGLVVGTVFAALFTTSDYLALHADWLLGRNPYGVLWYWLNPNFWTDIPYRIYVTCFLLITESMMYFLLVRHGKLSKFLFYAGWFQSLIWMRGSVYQNVTVTTFAPLISICPFVIALVLLQKLPIGWSWNFSDAHSWCAFIGNNGFVNGDWITFDNGQKLILCPGGWLRLNPAYSWFWSYLMIAFWVIVPFLFWLKPRWKVWRCKHKHISESPEGILYCNDCKQGDLH